MAWTIHEWSTEKGEGSIASPHFGPIPFGESANVDQVVDFRTGENVLVELEGDAPNFRVLTIRPANQRQPANTHWPAFDAVNGRFGDLRVEPSPPGSVQLWLGDCCEYCTPNPIRLRFHDVSAIIGLHDDLAFDDPLFRLASDGELRQHAVVAQPDHRVFCIVSSHGQGPDGPPVFIVARAAQVVPPGTETA